MLEIPLNMVEKQSLSVLIDNVLFELSFKVCNNIMAATIIRDGVTVIENRRVVAGVGLIPEGDREEGNFLILTNDDDLPYFTEFAATHVLVYSDEEETVAIREQLKTIVIKNDTEAEVEPTPTIKQPAITLQPIAANLAVGNKLTLLVVADNAVSYQWRKDGKVVGENSPSYTVNAVTKNDAGSYRVIITGEKYSSAVSSAAVSVEVS